MTREEFNQLDDNAKKIWIFEANKIAEREDGSTRFQLFKIGNFYVEAKTSTTHGHKRIITTYQPNELPQEYQSDVTSVLN